MPVVRLEEDVTVVRSVTIAGSGHSQARRSAVSIPFAVAARILVDVAPAADHDGVEKRSGGGSLVPAKFAEALRSARRKRYQR